jgi:undecaprenyl-diphosphatase
VELLQIAFLALVQGITEFLPISSSAHLILVPVITGWEDQGLAFDVAVHGGTLLAVLLYFRHEVGRMTIATFGSLRGDWTPDAKLAWAVVLGTLPVVVAGLLLKGYVEGPLRAPLVIATTTIVFGLLLWWADVHGRRARDEYTVSWRDAVLVGLAQAIALIPGVSRSGITITAGLLLGLTREGAARFSFLLSIPTLLASTVLVTRDLLQAAEPVDWSALAIGFALAAVSAYLCIHYFIRLLSRTGMLPYVIYRLVLGAVLFYLFW